MKQFSLLSSALLLFCLISACDAFDDDRAKALEVQNAIRRELGSSSHKPKPKKKTTSSTTTSSTSNASSASTDTNDSQEATNSDASSAIRSSKKPNSLKLSLGVAAAGALIAGASIHQRRRVVTEVKHPLEGSIAKRVENFEKFAGSHAHNDRPTLDYSAMADTAAMV